MKDWQNPKNFVIQLGALIALYISITSLITLVFGIINVYFPDELDYYWAMEGTREGMRVSIAFLVVFFPTYLVLTRISNQNRRQDENGEYTTLTKWLIYLSLLLGGGVLLGDLVTILIYFLNGEITDRFILKALALFVIVGIALYYYVLDVRGKVKTNERMSLQFGAGAIVLVLLAVIVGYLNIETPSEVRDLRFDDQQVSDLQGAQWRIEEFYRVEGKLPASLTEAYGEGFAPEAPEGRVAYQLNVVDETTYELCATFVHASQDNPDYRPIVPIDKDNYNWQHDAGEKCFKRVVESDTDAL